MAWGFISEIPITREQYDQLAAQLTEAPEGLILHTASQKGDAMRIIDVWESKDAYERFENEQLMPAMGQLGWDAPAGGPPPREEYEIHNMIGPGAP